MLLLSSVEWTKLMNKRCKGGKIHHYRTLQSAKRACADSSGCGCINYYASDEVFTINKAMDVKTVTGAIAYQRSTATSGIHCNILIFTYKSNNLAAKWKSRLRNHYHLECSTNEDCVGEHAKCSHGVCYRKNLSNLLLWLNN